MRRIADLGVDRSVERRGRDLARAVPRGGVRAPAAHRAVAGEGELAAGRALRPLEDHAADRFGEGGVAHAVEDHLRDRALADRYRRRLRRARRPPGNRSRGRASSASPEKMNGRAGGIGRGRERHGVVERLARPRARPLASSTGSTGGSSVFGTTRCATATAGSGLACGANRTIAVGIATSASADQRQDDAQGKRRRQRTDQVTACFGKARRCGARP